MFLVTIGWYKKYYKNVHISCLTSQPNHQKLKINEIIHPLDLDYFNKKVIFKLAIKSLLLRLFKINLFNRYEIKLVDLIQAQDIIHFTGGGNINSKYSNWLYYSLSIIAISKIFSKKIYITSHTFGPFKIMDYPIFILFINFVNKIVLREPTSFVTRIKFGIIFPKLFGSLDSAYFLKNGKYSVTSPKAFRIGLSIHNNSNNTQNIKFLKKTLTDISTKHKIELIFLPHILTSTPEHDYFYMKKFFKSSKNIKIINISNKQIINSPGETANIISFLTSTCNLCITTRYHGQIFSLSNSIPCYSIFENSYHKQKFLGAYKLTYGNKFSNKFLIGKNDYKNMTSNILYSIENIISEQNTLKQLNKTLKKNKGIIYNYIYN